MTEKKENIKNGIDITVDNGNITILNNSISLSEKKEEKENINNILANDKEESANVDLTPDIKLTEQAKEESKVETAVESSEPIIPEVQIPQVNIPTPEVPVMPEVNMAPFTPTVDAPITVNNDISLSNTDGDAFFKTPEFNQNIDNNSSNMLNNNYQNYDTNISNFNSMTYNNDLNNNMNSYNPSYSDSNPIYNLFDEIEDAIISVTKQKIAEAKEKAKQSVNDLEMYDQMSKLFSNFVSGNNNNRKM